MVKAKLKQKQSQPYSTKYWQGQKVVETHSFPVGMQNHMATLENILAAAYKVKIGPISLTPGYLPKRN